LEKQVQSLKEDVEQQKIDFENEKKEWESKQEQKEHKLRARLEASITEKNKFQKQVQTLKEQRIDWQKEKKSLKSDKGKWERENEQVEHGHQATTDLQNENVRLQSDMAKRECELLTLKQLASTTQEQLDEVHGSWQKQCKQLKSNQTEMNSKQTEIDHLNTQLQQLTSQSQDELASKQNEINSKQTEIDRLSTEVRNRPSQSPNDTGYLLELKTLPEILFTYPFEQKLRQSYIRILGVDYERLNPMQWLNDSLIDFWMQWYVPGLSWTTSYFILQTSQIPLFFIYFKKGFQDTKTRPTAIFTFAQLNFTLKCPSLDPSQ
jgi:hypothetical protein